MLRRIEIFKTRNQIYALFLVALVMIACDDGKVSPRKSEVTEKDAFNSFISSFYGPYKSEDWSTTIRIASSISSQEINQHFMMLAVTAEILADPDLGGFRTKWSGDDVLTSASFVRIAFCLISSAQGNQGPKGARLSDEQRKSVSRIWDLLYGKTMTKIGTPDDPVRFQYDEGRKRFHSANEIAVLLSDPTRNALSFLGIAWLAERTGDHRLADDMRELAAKGFGLPVKDIPWPPIIKKDGEYQFLQTN